MQAMVLLDDSVAVTQYSLTPAPSGFSAPVEIVRPVYQRESSEVWTKNAWLATVIAHSKIDSTYLDNVRNVRPKNTSMRGHNLEGARRKLYSVYLGDGELLEAV
jgi:hypothetical protein